MPLRVEVHQQGAKRKATSSPEAQLDMTFQPTGRSKPRKRLQVTPKLDVRTAQDDDASTSHEGRPARDYPAGAAPRAGAGPEPAGKQKLKLVPRAVAHPEVKPVDAKFKEAVESLDNWKTFIGDLAKRFDEIQQEDYKVTKRWTYTCLVCAKDMQQGAHAHVTSRAHYKAFWNYYERHKATSKSATDGCWQQAFTLARGLFVFNHLTGKGTWDKEGVLPTTAPVLPQAGAGAPQTQQLAIEGPAAGTAPTATAAPGPTLADALQDKEAWRNWMGSRYKALDTELLTHWKETQEWSFQCGVCRAPLQAINHLTSQKHWAVLKPLAKEQPPPSDENDQGLVNRELVQVFKLKQGLYLFDHLTGESRYAVEAEVAAAAAKLESAPLRAIKEEGEVAAGAARATTAVASPDKVPDAPCFQVAFLRDAAVPPHNYEPVWKTMAFGARHTGHVYGWVEPQDEVFHGWKTWRLRWKEKGKYHVVLGLDCTRWKDQGRVVNIMLNGTPAHPTMGLFQEVHAVVAIEPDLEICLDTPEEVDILCYMCLWPEEAPQPPVLEATTKRPTAPAFVESAHGVPSDWNHVDHAPKRTALFWGRRASKEFADAEPSGQANINVALDFLRQRRLASQESVLTLLGPPVRQGRGWFSLAWLPFERHEEDELRNRGWVRAWHGCKFEAMYSIIYAGGLVESKDKALGHRFFNGAPGIYVHKDATSRKAENYVRFVPLCGDGVFWAAKWEVRVNRAAAVKAPHKTDQWVQREGSVKLAALWICGRAAADMREGDPVARAWDPELEAHPKHWATARAEAKGQEGADDEFYHWDAFQVPADQAVGKVTPLPIEDATKEEAKAPEGARPKLVLVPRAECEGAKASEEKAEQARDEPDWHSGNKKARGAAESNWGSNGKKVEEATESDWSSKGKKVRAAAESDRGWKGKKVDEATESDWGANGKKEKAEAAEDASWGSGGKKTKRKKKEEPKQEISSEAGWPRGKYRKKVTLVAREEAQQEKQEKQADGADGDWSQGGTAEQHGKAREEKQSDYAEGKWSKGGDRELRGKAAWAGDAAEAGGKEEGAAAPRASAPSGRRRGYGGNRWDAGPRDQPWSQQGKSKSRSRELARTEAAGPAAATDPPGRPSPPGARAAPTAAVAVTDPPPRGRRRRGGRGGGGAPEGAGAGAGGGLEEEAAAPAPAPDAPTAELRPRRPQRESQATRREAGAAAPAEEEEEPAPSQRGERVRRPKGGGSGGDPAAAAVAVAAAAEAESAPAAAPEEQAPPPRLPRASAGGSSRRKVLEAQQKVWKMVQNKDGPK